MNGSKARKIRKLIYGDYSHRPRQYHTKPNGQRVNLNLRAKYLIAKKLAK